MRRAPGLGMTKWLLGVASLGVGLCFVAACGGDKDDDKDAACPTGSLACLCYANQTCNDGLECFAPLGVCTPPGAGFGGFAGALGFGGEASVGEGGAGGSEDTPTGGVSGGTSLGGKGGSISGGGLGSGGVTAGTSSGGLGSGGSTTTNPFPDSEAACALVTSCPDCCETVGVYALDVLSNDATRDYVTAFDADETAAVAEYDLFSPDDIGAIFFRFKSAQNIGSLKIVGTGTGGSLEIALVRAGGKDGCIYPIVGGTLSPVPDTCWGLGAGPYAALPADQIEVRVRSSLGGRAALSVTGLQYGP